MGRDEGPPRHAPVEMSLDSNGYATGRRVDASGHPSYADRYVSPRTLLICAALGLASGCFGPGSRTPQGDPVAMSRSEFDLATDLWIRQGKPREALEHALKAVDLDDENPDAPHLVALLYLDFCRQAPEDCRLEEAEAQARRALRIKPDYREAKNTLGVILIHRKRYGDAIAVLRPLTADMLYQTPENAWGNLGWAYLESGQTRAAIDALERSVAAQPMFCVGNYRLGLAYEKNDQPRRAEEALTRALTTNDPGCQRLQVAVFARARVRMKLGEGDAAREDLELCVQLGAATPAGEECRSMLRKLQ
jgi:type IV pilus assembly protein PilF